MRKLFICTLLTILLSGLGLMVVSTQAMGAVEYSDTQVTATIDLTRKRAIGGIASLDRETWFGVYHETGYGRRQFIDKGRTMSFDEWIHEEGGMWPSRGTVNFMSIPEDPTRPTYADPRQFYRFNHLFDSRYAWAKQVAPSHKTVMSGEGHGKYPAYMCWDPALTHDIYTVKNNEAHAEAVVHMLEQLESRNGLMPHWFEVMNESSIQSNYGWHWDHDAWDKLSDFHARVGDAVHASKYKGIVKVAGPTDAYPFRDGSAGDFSQWQNTDKKFIQLAGDHIDAYAIHTYEQMPEQSTCSFDDQFERFEIWHQGRLRSFIDLWENEHHLMHGGTLPFVFSEYGLLRNRSAQGDRNAYYQLRSCNGILLSLLDRPDIVDKMSAFILTQAPYNWDQKRVFFASEDRGQSYYKTSYFEYLRFWKELEGEYLFTQIDHPHLVLHAFLATTPIPRIYVVMKNNYNQDLNVNVQSLLPDGIDILDHAVQRLYYNGIDDVQRDPFQAITDLNDLEVVPDETVMLRMTLNESPELDTWQETHHYGSRTLVPLDSLRAEDFTFDVNNVEINEHTTGQVHLSLYAFKGFTAQLPRVKINGVNLTQVPDLRYTAHAPRVWKQVTIPIPAGLLQSGTNTVTLTPVRGGDKITVTSVRLTTITEPVVTSESLGRKSNRKGFRIGNDLRIWMACLTRSVSMGRL